MHTAACILASGHSSMHTRVYTQTTATETFEVVIVESLSFCTPLFGKLFIERFVNIVFWKVTLDSIVHEKEIRILCEVSFSASTSHIAMP